MTHTLARFRQTAVGSFATYGRPGTPHCGPKTGFTPQRQTLGYSLEIVYRASALDTDGFLLDNTWFRSYFEAFSASQVAISCEKLACVIAQDLCRSLGSRLCACESVTVVLEPLPGVTVSCTYVGVE